MTLAPIYLGLGSNLGDRHGNIKRAIELLSSRIHVEQISSIYETEPVGFHDQPPFLNAVCQGYTSLEPREILIMAQEVEMTLGRTATFRNGPRIIDIDILIYGSQIIDTPQLTVPHPRLAERAFVLVPLAELAPHLVHPVSGMSARDLAENVNMEGIERWDGEEKDV